MSNPSYPPPRGGASGKSMSPRKTVYKGDKAPPMWEEFVAHLKKVREDSGLKPRDVADLMGVAPGLILVWERGKTTPHPWDLVVYMETIGVTSLRAVTNRTSQE